MCKGFVAQIGVDRTCQVLFAELGSCDNSNGHDLSDVAEKVRENYRSVEEESDAKMEPAWHGVSGAMSDPVAVRDAMAKEIY